MTRSNNISKRNMNYEAFWGREPDFILHPEDQNQPHIDILRFPPVTIKRFYQKWFKPVSDQYVYITGGMSDGIMPVPDTVKGSPAKIELTAFSSDIYKNKSESIDLIAWWLSFLAYQPFKEGIFFAPGHTYSVGEPIIPGSLMNGFIFAVTPSVEMSRLCSASLKAKLFLHVIPVSDNERRVAANEGLESLITHFDKNGIEPVFNLKRESVI